ncbi:Putative RNA-binding protein [Aspergillus calidoustus]|uniref:Putative RNA-binding protein n=1 Tax=Aspergillus calidoustus TaxID=454130 RepID=A0A0U5CDP8_ASPCI|nr:Putative RNA-binding protein [Aspergillus calidoustus]
MTPDSPDEAFHFRGKTLTPESPRPVHVAEPANIPVLQNQMDPVFNDTSTYQKAESVYENAYHVPQNGHYTTGGEVRGNPGPVQDGQEQRPLHLHQQDPSFLPAHPLPGAPPSSSHAPRDASFANEVDHPITNLQTQAALHGRLDAEHKHEDSSAGNGVDFQNLLDNLPSSTAASALPVPGNTISAGDPPTSPQAAAGEASQFSLGLPPRPPPQAKPSIHPNYNPSDDIRSYHQLPTQTSPSSSNPYASQQSNYQSTLGPTALSPAVAPGTSLVAVETQDASPATQKNGPVDRQPARSDEDTPWGPDVQKKYDEFLRDERVYVTEGLWDRFPYGSRLFVGNLPTERVTKRDLFHIFHSYGKLAQISIKQAYGFIQFLEASSCKRALEGEQGAVVRGRKVHLEISKPQRNTRPAPPPSEAPRAPPPRRSRSPDYSRGGAPNNRSARASGERFDRSHEPGRLPFSDFRDEPTHRRRDDYRPSPRSPSPRSYRPREGYRSRDRTPERFDRRGVRRSRSPYGRERRYRSPSPRGRSSYDDDADLPVPRRVGRDVPDVQILVLEELDRNFVYHVESSFRNRGLRVDVLALGPRIPLDAAVKRQVSEGVLAVVRLSRPSQFSRKLPLQVFDRSAGKDNVRSSEYPDLEPSIAAEIVFQAQALQRNAPGVPFAPSTYGVPPIPSVQMPPAVQPPLAAQPNLANAISTLDGPALQSLIAALQQPRQPAIPTAQPSFPAPANPLPTPDLASLLSAATRQPIPPNAAQQSLHQQSQPFPQQGPTGAAISDPNLLSLLAKGLGGLQPQSHAALPPHVQNIMSQLGKWKP